jgi:transcription elongation factor GreA
MDDFSYEPTSPGDYREEREDDYVLTEEGYRELREELEYLKNVKMREVAKRLEEARSFGDLSENSEYEDAKHEQAFVQGRIVEIERILENARVMKEEEIDLSEVTLGSVVELEDLERGEKMRFRLVSSAETKVDGRHLSDRSPVGKAILGRKKGETVEVSAPSGSIRYRILNIER